MPISRRLLEDDEEVLVDVRRHAVFMAGPAIASAVALAAAVGVVVELPTAPVAVAGALVAMLAVPVLWLLARVVRWRGISLTVTSSRVVYRSGLLGRDVTQLRLSRIVGVRCRRTLVDRVIGSGRLELFTGREEPFVVAGVPRPRALERVVSDLAGRVAPLPGNRAAPGTAMQPSPPATPAVPAGPVPLDETPPQGTPAQGRHPGPLSARQPSWAGSYARSAAGPSVPDQLIQLDELRRRGIISDSEFDAKKAELLSRF